MVIAFATGFGLLNRSGSNADISNKELFPDSQLIGKNFLKGFSRHHLDGLAGSIEDLSCLQQPDVLQRPNLYSKVATCLAVALADWGFWPVTSRPSITTFETNGSHAFS